MRKTKIDTRKARNSSLMGELGHADAVKLLDATLQEDKKTDAAPTQIAETMANQEAG